MTTRAMPSAMQRTAAAKKVPATPGPVEVIALDQQVRIPETAWTLDGFRQWAVSDDFPQRGCISFIGGEIIVDMSPEELSTHNALAALYRSAPRVEPTSSPAPSVPSSREPA